MIETALLQNKLLAQQVLPIFKSTLAGGLSNIFCAMLIYVLLMNNHQQLAALAISSSIITLSVIQIIFSNRYLKQENNSNLDKYLKSHFLLTLAIGICWGLIAFMQKSQQDPVIVNIVFLVNFGIIAASITTLSSWMPSYLAYMLPQSIAIFSVFILQSTVHGNFLALSYLIFTGMMISTSCNANKRHLHELDLIFKNRELIDDLNDEIDQREVVQYLLEESKHDLEEKAKQRTQELTVINKNLKNEILEKQKIEVNLEYIAYHDELTGLPNKALLVDRITQSIESAHRYNNQLGILFLDLDRFKKHQ